MESKTKELVKAGRELVVLLGNQHGMLDAASLVQRLTAQLDITAAALREMTKKHDDEHADVLAWEKTMFKVCGEDGTKSVAAKFASLEAERDQLAAENAALKAGVKYFSYSDMAGFEEHSTADSALKSADADLSGERDEASSDGWSEETETICWGVILQKAVEDKFESPSEENGWIGWSDYTLLPSIVTPATDRFLAEQRAQGRVEGINYAAGRLAAAYNHGFVDKPLTEVGDVVRMILDARDELTRALIPAADGLSGEYAEKALKEWEAQLRNEVKV